jgi:flavorubredoxin
MAARHQGTLNRPNPLPREVAPGVFWLGECLEQRQQGKIYHGCNACFLIVGGTASMLVETGHPKDFPIIEGQLNKLLPSAPPLKYLFVTHQETPHCGGLGRVLSRFPDAILCGDVSDYHLAFPHFEHRMRMMKDGDEIDLGGRGFRAVEPVVRDMRTTWWGFETRDRVLFPGDGFAYSHYHEDGHCGLVAEEAVSLDLPDVSSTFADLALFWTKFADMNVYCDRLDHLIDRLGVKVIAPTHGLPITDVKSTVPKVQQGLKEAALMPESGTNEKMSAAPVVTAAE